MVEPSAMTHHLAAWIAEADAFEIPKSIQKGLLFVTGLSHSIGEANEQGKYRREVLLMLSDQAEKLDEYEGGEFRPDPISDLLVELTLQLDEGFAPKQLRLPSGTVIPSFSPNPERRLPTITHRKRLKPYLEMAKSLLHQIGEEIDEEEEGSLLGGIQYASAYGTTDLDSTWRLGQAVGEILPPHMLWLSRAIRFPAEELQKFNAMGKVLWMTMGGTEFYDYGLPLSFSTEFHYKDRLKPRPEVWEAGMRTYVEMMIRRAVEFFGDPDILPFVKISQPYANRLPLVGMSLEQAVEHIVRKIEEDTDFNLDAPLSGHYFGEMLDLRYFITDEVVTQTVANPNWARLD